LLLDEPFSNLDYEVKLQLEATLIGLVGREGITVVVVTHDLEEAIVLGEDILVLSKRPAQLITSYSIDLPLSDRDPLLMRQSRLFAEKLGQLGRLVLNRQ
jgi:NitT/TauT family transport system ATP-binding protein